MSASNRARGSDAPARAVTNKGRGGYTPARRSTEEFMALGVFFKQLLAENPLIKASIVAAGIGGALESLHVLWLAGKYLGLVR